MNLRASIIAELRGLGKKTFTRSDILVTETNAAVNVVLRALRLDGAIKVIGSTRYRGGKFNIYDIVDLDAVAKTVEERVESRFSFDAWKGVYPEMFEAPIMSGESLTHRMKV